MPTANIAPIAQTTQGTQKILWTSLPRGMNQAGSLKLTVMVSPRLNPSQDSSLAKFSDFVDWPGAVKRALSFSVQIGRGTPGAGGFAIADVDASSVNRVSPDPDASLWAMLFPPTTLVQGHNPTAVIRDMSGRGPIHHYPVRNILAYVKGTHQALGIPAPFQLHLVSHPKIAEVAQKLGQITVPETHRIMMQTLRAQPQRITATTHPSTLNLTVTKEGFDFALLHAFHTRKKSAPTVSQAQPAGPPPPPKAPSPLDFHHIIAALGDYPDLLRRLGLIIDLEFPMGGVPPEGFVRVIPHWKPARQEQEVTPWTAYVIAGPTFAAAVKDKESYIKDGAIDLTGVNDLHQEIPSPFDIVQVDPDSAGKKHMNFASTIFRKSQIRLPVQATSHDESIALPALRSAGISLTRLDRHIGIEDGLVRAGQWTIDDPAKPPTFYAEDLLRGYRVDILDESLAVPVWRSLCERVGTYRLKGNLLNLPADEGYVKAASASSNEPGGPLYLHESLFRWTGWSLCARYPGRAILHDDSVDDVKNSDAQNIGLEVTFKPKPGCLPRLCFGHRYRMRVRTVDLAGGGLSLSDTPEFFSDPIVYTRFEPINPPVVVLRDVVSEGESLETMVIRSSYNQTAAEYSASSPVVAALQGRSYTYHATNERHLVPPKISQLLAEWHGMFDKSFGPDKTPAERDTGYNLALREAGNLASDTIIDISTGRPKNVTGIKIVSPSSGSAGRYFVHTEEQLQVPYLPDCIARGVALAGVPGAVEGALQGDVVVQKVVGTAVLRVPFAGSWPETQPFRLRIQERHPGLMPAAGDEQFDDSGQPHWDPASRVLTVFLAKAQVARLRYSCYPADADVMVGDTPHHGWLHWQTQGPGGTTADGGAIQAATQTIGAGGCAGVSPFRELVLVHAVQQPLTEPKIARLTVAGIAGSTSVDLGGQMLVSTGSTGKVDLLAAWTETIDDPLREAGPKLRTGSAHVAEVPIGTAIGPQSTAIPFPVMHHGFGDTKYRAVSYHLRGTTRFREHFPPEITKVVANITRDGPPITVGVPNRTRPAAPKLRYIVPSFGWWTDQGSSPGSPSSRIVRRRMGGGLRVYLDRPWFSSGDGELLGIVLRVVGSKPFNDNDDPLKHLVSQWGTDPIVVSAPPPLATVRPQGGFNEPGPTISNFVGAKQWARSLVLEELPRAAVDVVGYEVHYDPQRRLWYADVRMEPGPSYFPFVRLALARFQPNSVAKVELSRVIAADFGQLLPHRTLTVDNVHPDSNMLSVTVQGIAPLATGARRPNRIAVAAQMRDPNNADPDIGWLPVPSCQINPFSSLPSEGLWSGTITFREAIGTGKYRVVVTEFEQYEQVDRSEAPERAVYVDAVAL